MKKYFTRIKILSLILNVIIPFSFALYNGIFGIIYHSIWHGSISLYYLLLLTVRIILLFSEKKAKISNDNKLRKRAFITSFVIMLIMNLALILPTILMILDKKEINVGLVPSIAIATYTTYSIVMSVINLKRTKNSNNLIEINLKIVSFCNSLVSILSLQNTLIVVNGGYDNDLVTLSVISSAGILSLMLFVIVFAFATNINKKR